MTGSFGFPVIRAAVLGLFAFGYAGAAPMAPNASRLPDEPADTVLRHYRESVRTFRHLAQTLAAGEDLRRRDVDRLRASYKRIEFLTAYAYPGSAEHLNAPPLERANARMPDAMEVLPPEGLQILQRIAYETTRPTGSVPDWRTIARDLAAAAQELEANLGSVSFAVLDDRGVFEAMQQQVLRVMTLGITGFDPPRAEFALPESRLSLEALRPVIALYLPALRRRDRGLAARLPRALERAVAALPRRTTEAGFGAFDRLEFIRRAGNPLYAALIDAQHALGIATFADLAPLQRPVSVTARNLFAPDFLDPHYYARTAGERRDTVVEQLGRRLFFDPALSLDRTRSCAGCHDPGKAFSDGLPRSPAFSGGSLLRNAPGLSHAAYQSDQFWDMRAATLEQQTQFVIAGEEEFRNDFMTVLDRLKRDPEYPVRFQRAFGNASDGSDALQLKTVAKALAMYLRSLGRWNSPFDRYMRGESGFLDPAAKHGFNLFMGRAGCATCHFPPAFNGTVPPAYLETESEVLGTPDRYPPSGGEPLRLDSDRGRGMTQLNPLYQGAFKTPGLRNVALTAPYMHNGSMARLEDVLDFYNAGGGRGLGLDVPHQTLPPDSLHLTKREMADIIAFLGTLTDTTGYERMKD